MQVRLRSGISVGKDMADEQSFNVKD